MTRPRVNEVICIDIEAERTDVAIEIVENNSNAERQEQARMKEIMPDEQAKAVGSIHYSNFVILNSLTIA